MSTLRVINRPHLGLARCVQTWKRRAHQRASDSGYEEVTPMARSVESAAEVERNPRTIHYCPVCGCQTLHEIKSLSGSSFMKCVACTDQALRFELDRD